MNPEETDKFQRFEQLIRRIVHLPPKDEDDPEKTDGSPDPSEKPSGRSLEDPRD